MSAAVPGSCPMCPALLPPPFAPPSTGTPALFFRCPLSMLPVPVSAYYLVAIQPLATSRAAVARHRAAAGSWQMSNIIDEAGHQYVDLVIEQGGMQAALAAGQSVRPADRTNVQELNTNSLYNWFEKFRADLGWRRSVDLTEVQNATNMSPVCIISGQRKDLNAAGHICAVVPENPEERACDAAANEPVRWPCVMDGRTVRAVDILDSCVIIYAK